MNNLSIAWFCRWCLAGLLLTLAAGCGSLLPKPTPQPTFYSLDLPRSEPGAAVRAVTTPSSAWPTLLVGAPHAAAGFDSQRIIYMREAHKLEYFARSEWVDTPARMLAPLIVAAVANGGGFRAVLPTPSTAAGDLRLDTDLLRLQHDFDTSPSRVRFTLRATLVDSATRRVLAWREFEASAAAASDDPYGGVVAANRAVQTVLQQLAGFCLEEAGMWQARPTETRKPVIDPGVPKR